MALINLNDSAIGDEILASTLRLILEQPSGPEYVIRVEHLTGTVEGTIVEWDGTTLVIADMDDEAQHTGAQTTIDIHDIAELEIF